MAPLATAYSGPPKLTLVRAFTEWRIDVPMLVLIALLGAWYLVSVRKVRRGGGRWGFGRTCAFIVLGLGFWVIATMSSVGVYQSTLFYTRATQTVLLVLLSPLFLAMGKPLTLLIEAYPGPGRRVEKVVRSRVAKVVTFPAITAFLIVAVPMSMYFTSWYTHFFTSGTVRELTYVILMTPGYLFFWTLLRVDPVPKEYPYGVGMWITAAEVVGDAFFGIAVIADQTILGAAHYHAVGYPFGPSLATGQVLGGGIIWILGDSVGLPFLGVQLIQMMRADKREAEEIDAELDARDAARAAVKAKTSSGTATSGADSAPATASSVTERPAAASSVTERPAAADDDLDAEAMAASSVTQETDESAEPDRPWWETDSRLTDRFKRA